MTIYVCQSPPFAKLSSSFFTRKEYETVAVYDSLDDTGHATDDNDGHGELFSLACAWGGGG